MEATTQEMAATDTSAISRAEKLWAGKLDSLECQTGPFGFPGGSDNTWSLVGAEGKDFKSSDLLVELAGRLAD
jgi:hypothetical protein